MGSFLPFTSWASLTLIDNLFLHKFVVIFITLAKIYISLTLFYLNKTLFFLSRVCELRREMRHFFSHIAKKLMCNIGVCIGKYSFVLVHDLLNFSCDEELKTYFQRDNNHKLKNLTTNYILNVEKQTTLTVSSQFLNGLYYINVPNNAHTIHKCTTM